ncbi:FtsX-like permease family protein [Saccharicrinis sp. FJH2]|uniref:FtsX-like permease family protein n=1 Tax=Saccharicrinis sp. FJH65 TaxID=3344659 RepID=UPI0035F4231B
MRLALQIARRYLFAKKSHTVINVISMISVAGVTIGTMALIVVLSVFNGFEDLIGKSYSAFNPDLKILPASGKVFNYTAHIDSVLGNSGAEWWSKVIEDQAFVSYDDKQSPVIIKGVDQNFVRVSGLDTMLVEGRFTLWNEEKPTAVVGYGLARTLRIGLKFIAPIVIHAPKREKQVSMINPESNFISDYLYPSGLFVVYQPEYDMNYIILPIEEAQKLFDYTDQVTQVELKVPDSKDLKDVQSYLEKHLGSDFKVLNRFQQQEEFYNMMNIEKWITYLILMFVLFIATFNLISSLSMLMMDKKDDIDTLRNLGANSKLIRMIFVFEGWIISLVGTILGLILGGIFVRLQMVYGLLKLSGGGNFIIEYYPVNVLATDFVIVSVSVIALGFLASWYPVRRITSKILG